MSDVAGKADVILHRQKGPLMTVVSTGRRNTLIFSEKMECLNEAKTSDIFHE